MTRFDIDLCTPGQKVKHQGRRLTFTCSDKTDPDQGIYPCTGGAHPEPGVEILCTCPCHRVEVGDAAAVIVLD